MQVIVDLGVVPSAEELVLLLGEWRSQLPAG